MKIVIRTEETNLTLRLPGFLLYGRLGSRIAGGLARKYLPAEMPLPADAVARLMAELRRFRRAHPHWVLVDVQSSSGEIVRITL